MTIRDVGIVLYCLTLEHSSLRAFYLFGRDFKRTLEKRRLIQERRRVDDSYMLSWFRFAPSSRPMKTVETAPEPVKVREL